MTQCNNSQHISFNVFTNDHGVTYLFKLFLLC